MDAKTVAGEIRSILDMPGTKVARTALTKLAESLEATARDDEERAKKYEALQDIGKSAAEGIASMVAALECDYDRLEELRDEREALAKDKPGRTKSQLKKARAALEEWDEENGEELKELTKAAGECTSKDNAVQHIREDPLSVQLTFSACDPGATPEADGFEILLDWGGPATRIVGELDEHDEPKRAWIETQNWGTAWTEYHGDGCSQDSLLTYCRQFYLAPG